MKKKIYIVPIRSHVSGDYIIEATSKKEAHEIVSKEMEESLNRLLSQAKPHPQIKNLSGYTEAMKSLIEIQKDEEFERDKLEDIKNDEI